VPLREIVLRVPNRPGELARIARVFAHERINLAAISVDSTAKQGSVRLVVNDPERALGLLRAAGYTVETHELLALELEDRAGSFLRVLDVLAKERINVRSVVILVARAGGRALVGVAVDELEQARKALRGTGYLSESAERLVSNADLVAGSPTIPEESVGMLL
jgi:hypothetical protein